MNGLSPFKDPQSIRAPETNSRIVISQTLDPFLNMALEDYFFQNLKENDELLFIWRNRKAVIIGRFQNPYIECNLGKMEAHSVPLLRRLSGGGTVYHDPGNLNFSFLSSLDLHNKKKNTTIIIKAIQRYFEIDVYSNDRNDIFLSGHKISGSAYKQTGNKALHHCTLLFAADLNNLAAYLNPEKRAINSKGIRSVPSSVTNLSLHSDMVNTESLTQAVTTLFCETRGRSIKKEYLGEAEIRGLFEVENKYRQYSEWEWLYGKSPPFTIEQEKLFSWGEAKIHLAVKAGRFEEVDILTNKDETVGKNLAPALFGLPARRDSILGIKRNGVEAETLLQWIADLF